MSKENTNQEILANYVTSISGQSRIITILKTYIEIFDGDIYTALFFNQMIFWSDKGKRKDGWFWKSYVELEDEIGISQYKAKKAANLLIEKGVLETKIKKVSGAPTMHYRVDMQAFIKNLIMENEKFNKPGLSNLSQSLTVNNTDKDNNNKQTSPADDPAGVLYHNTPNKKETDKPSRKKKKRDIRLDHPAIISYREVMRFHVPIVLRDAVILTFGDDPEQPDTWASEDDPKSMRWEAHVKLWLARGYNPRNVDGIMQSYTEDTLKDNGRKKEVQLLGYDVDEHAEFERLNPGKKIPVNK